MTTTTKTRKTVTISTGTGPVEITVAWLGANLAVHRPYRVDPEMAKLDRGRWDVTHTRSGLRAASIIRPQAAVIALAKLWDAAFADVTSSSVKQWRYRQTWVTDCRAVMSGCAPTGPILPDHPTTSDVAAAIAAAHGSTYVDLTPEESEEQWPAAITTATEGSGAVRRNAETGRLEYCWLPQGGNYPFRTACELRGWYEVPATGDVERWCLDSVAETPCGDSVEPDHPDAWPRLLGLI